jgi:hypothetical protein
MTTPIPRRDDHVATWLRAERDKRPACTLAYDALDDLLDTYRLHADTGIPLDRHACEGGTPHDCYGCHEQAERDKTAAEPPSESAPNEQATEWGVRTETGYVLGPLGEQVARRALNPSRTLVRRTATYGPWTTEETQP